MKNLWFVIVPTWEMFDTVIVSKLVEELYTIKLGRVDPLESKAVF